MVKIKEIIKYILESTWKNIKQNHKVYLFIILITLAVFFGLEYLKKLG